MSGGEFDVAGGAFAVADGDFGVAGLLIEPGAGVLAAAAAIQVSDPLRAAAELARICPDAPPELRAAALTQVALRRHASARFGDAAERMFFTRAGLEQCTRPTVAVHRAASLRTRAPDARTALDLCCGLGSDLIALARAGLAVTGVDRDPEALVAARANLGALGLTGQLVEADVTAVDLGSADVVVTDPARRTADGKRLRDPERFSPPWSWVRSLLDRPGIRACVTTSPALAQRDVPADCEAEWVDDAGSTVELAVWSPALTDGGIRRRATLLDRPGLDRPGLDRPGLDRPGLDRRELDQRGLDRPGLDGSGLVGSGGVSLTDADDGAADVPAVGEPQPGQWVLEPRGAILRAGLLGVLAARVGGTVPGPGIGYLLTDDPAGARDPATGIELATARQIVEVLPLRARVLRQRLRTLGVGSVEILARGVQVDIASLRSQLLTPGAGTAAATLVLTRTRAGAVALMTTDRAFEENRATAPDRAFEENRATAPGRAFAEDRATAPDRAAAPGRAAAEDRAARER